MPIDGVLWGARVGFFNAFKFQTQVKSNMKNPLLFLKIFLFFINYVYARLIYLISFSTFCFLTNIFQLVDVDIFFLLYIKILLYCCGDIEINPSPKRSSLTFCHWNLNAPYESKSKSCLWVYQSFIITGVCYRTQFRHNMFYLKPSLILLLIVKV